jgi:glycosyltransferase 2 family protein
MSSERDGGHLSSGMRRLAKLATSPWVRAAVTLTLLGVVASTLDWSQIAARLRDGHPVDFLLAVALVVLALAVGAWRWRALLHRAGVPLELSRLARIYAVSTFSATFLPSTAGGDVSRALLVARRGPQLRRAVVSILVDRLGGLAGLVALAWLALALAPDRVPDDARTLLVWATVALVLGSVAVLAAMLRGSRLLRRVVPQRLAATAQDVRAVVTEYARDPRLLTTWLVLSVAYQALIAFQLVVLARAIDVELSFATAAVALALVTLITLIPISIGGFGVREGSYVVLLGGVSIAASDATLISVLSAATLLVASLPGAWMIMRGNVGAVPEPLAS